MPNSDPRTRKGNDSYPAPGSESSPEPSSAPAAPTSTVDKAVAPEQPDGNSVTNDVPPGSSTTTVPQQIPKQRK